MDIIIAIDIINGHCVRLQQGDFNKVNSYYDDPLEAALLLESSGIRRLHLVDLDGARTGKIQNLKTLDRIANHTNLHIDFGGGVKTQADVQQILDAGAKMVAIGSIAVNEKKEALKWASVFGKDKLFIGADVKNKMIAINGWLKESEITVDSLIEQYLQHGINNFFCTDISKDGMLQGPAISLYQQLMASFPELQLTASGGVSNIEDVKRLKEIGCAGAIIGKAFYEKRITLEQLQQI